MKYFYFLFIFCFGITLNAQVVVIPDANFKAKILSSSPSNTVAKNLSGAYFSVDVNGDGEIQNLEAEQVEYLSVSYSSIASIEGINSFLNLESLNCNDNQLISINISGLAAFKTLTCVNNMLTSISVSGATNFTGLECYNNQLADGSLTMSQLINLNYLWCHYNQFTTLDISGMPNLNVLSAHHNQLTSINFGTITHFYFWLFVNDNQLTTLNFPNNIAIERLDFSNNAIPNFNWSSLSAPHLNYLFCNGTGISGALNLSAFTNLQLLGCSNNQLTSLNLTGLTDLKSISCHDNQLGSLTLSGFPVLESLNFGNNPMMNPPNINTLSAPAVLKYLTCNNLGITSLNLSTFTNLQQLDCTYNELQSLNVNALVNLTSFDCSNNPSLVSISAKNSKNESTAFSGCPNLQYICADDSQLSSVQSKITQYGYTNCHVNSYCSFVPGGTFYTIQGAITHDYNSNGCGFGDSVVPNQKLVFTNGTATSNLISNSTGNYSYAVQAGTNTITPSMENSGYFIITPASYSVTFPTQTSPATRNFCLTNNGTHNDLEIVIVPTGTARPGFDAMYKIIYKNKGTHTQSGTISLTFEDDILDFVSAFPTVTTQTLNNLSWGFTNLLPFQTREIQLTLNVNSPTETPAVNLGDILNYTVQITGLTDETPNDNSLVFNQSVVNSFDPNDKTCLEGTQVNSSVIGEYVHYMIRFENNGTANAQHIVVRDIIDTIKFDIATLRVINSSHLMATKITGNNKVEFLFQNINLPYDDANNDGYVTFKIKTKSTLTIGNSFTNSASIYFDYNFPIITNIATTTIQGLSNPDFVFNDYFILSPNPAENVLNIQNKQDIQISSLTIYNALGQVILISTQPSESIDVSTLKTGTYFVKINSNKGSSSVNFLKK